MLRSVAYSDFVSFHFGFHHERAENVLIVERDGWKLDVDECRDPFAEYLA